MVILRRLRLHDDHQAASISNPHLLGQRRHESALTDTPRDMRQGLIDLINENQAQIALLQGRQRRIDGQELAMD